MTCLSPATPFSFILKTKEAILRSTPAIRWEEMFGSGTGCCRTKVQPSLDHPSSLQPVLPAPDKVGLSRLHRARQDCTTGYLGSQLPETGFGARSMPNEDELWGRNPEGPGNIMVVLF